MSGILKTHTRSETRSNLSQFLPITLWGKSLKAQIRIQEHRCGKDDRRGTAAKYDGMSVARRFTVPSLKERSRHVEVEGSSFSRKL